MVRKVALVSASKLRLLWETWVWVGMLKPPRNGGSIRERDWEGGEKVVSGEGFGKGGWGDLGTGVGMDGVL